MKAAILRAFNNVVVEELTLPDKLEVGQVLVRMQATTICGAQIGEITGAKGPDSFLPHLLGHEGCGIVEAVGLGVSHVRIGDRVILHWRKGKGIEAKPAKYLDSNDKYVGSGPVATFAEATIVSENRLTVIENDIPSCDASLLGCAVTTALGLINNEAQLKIGQSIAVAGVGGVGLNIIQGAMMVSANPIVAIDIVDQKLSMAKLLGATHTILMQGIIFSELMEKFSRIVGRKSVDVFVDCTGNPGVVDYGLNLVSSGGKMILVGQPIQDSAFIFPHARGHYTGKTILDSQGGLTDPNIDIPRYINLYRKNVLNLDVLITHTFKLDEIQKAILTVMSGNAGRVALGFN